MKPEEQDSFNLKIIFTDMVEAQEKIQKLLSDLSSPYFLHSADHPRTPLVDVVLTHTNYGSWRRSIEMALCAKNKLGFIDNTLPCPTDPDLQPLWKRVSTMVLSWLLSSISSTISPSLASCRTPYELWRDLESRFTQGNNATIFKIQKEISNLEQNNLDITNYFNTFKTLWSRLDAITPLPACTCNNCTCNTAATWQKRVSDERVYQLLMGLNEPFFVLRTQILAMDPLPDIGKVYGLLISEEQTKLSPPVTTTQPTQEDSAMISYKPHANPRAVNHRPSNPTGGQQRHHHVSRSPSINQSSIQAHPLHHRPPSRPQFFAPANQPRPPHTTQISSNQPSSSRTEKDPNAFCTHCNRKGHYKSGCFKLIGYPDWFYNRLANPNEGRSNYAAQSEDPQASGFYDNPSAFFTGNEEFPSPEWIIDSGASSHMTPHLSFFNSYTATDTILPVRSASGSTHAVSHKGDITVTSSITLFNVSHVPTFQFNLISVQKLCQDLKCIVFFFPTFCLFQDLKSKTVIGAGDARNGLYYLRTSSSTALATPSDDPTLWHRRLGHPAPTSLPPSFVSRTTNKFPCDACLRGKHTRLPFFPILTKSTIPFARIFVDIWGGYHTFSTCGARYFLTIVDDCTRTTWVYLLRYKSDALSKIQFFINMVQTHFNTRVQSFRSDNGKEFLSAPIQKLFHDNGILQELTNVDSPQQNGVAERKHRHILNVARCLRFQAHLPIKFWGECVLTAVYLINRTPSKNLKNLSPYECLYRRAPNYKFLRVFGCLCYAQTSRVDRDKFQPRGVPCVFLGYPPRHSGYRLFNLDTNTFFISRDITFFENIFPFDSHSPHHIIPPSDPAPSLTNLYPTEPLHLPVLPTNNTPTPPTTTQPVPITSAPTNLPTPTNQPSSSSPDSPTPSPQPPPNNNSPRLPNPSDPTSPLTSRPTRTHRPPGYLQDYLCPTLPTATTASTPASSQSSGTAHPLHNFVSYSHFSPSHFAFISALSTSHDPTSYSQAIKHAHWRDAISKELNALEQNNTWTLTPLPPGKTSIGCKWVFKTKIKADGSVERYKARLVAKGYTQIEGLDFHDTFAPVAKLVTVRCVLAIAATRQWHLHQLDVNNAFLHGDLEEDVYMSLPPGYGTQGEIRVCHLQKSLYGLKQASRNWYSKLSTVLLSAGFKQSQADHSLFTRQSGSTILVVLVYVDDLLVTGNDLASIRQLQEFLSRNFQLKDLGKLKYFLGIEVARSRAGIFINQRKYILDILTDAGQSGCRPASSPMEQHLKLSADSGDPLSDPSSYRRLIGRLIYLTISRPDITFAVNLLSQFMNTPRVPHLDAATHLLRYLKGSLSHGLLFSSHSDLTVTAYTDSDWASCPMTRRSTTGYFITLGGSPVSWRTKKQSVVSRSSAEAEYRAMASTTCELLWLRALLNDLAVPISTAITLYCDNQAALHIARNPVFHERSKHIEIDCHLIRERVQQGFLQLRHISSVDQLADIFTKALGVAQFRTLTSKMGITSLHAPS
jgi:transposase InsO family protein